MNLRVYHNQYLPHRLSDAWKQTLDGSGVAEWLRASGEDVVSNRGYAGGSYAQLRDGTKVYNNGYVQSPATAEA